MFNGLAAVSAVLFVGVCVLWRVSHFKSGALIWIPRLKPVLTLTHPFSPSSWFKGAQLRIEPGVVRTSYGLLPYGLGKSPPSLAWEPAHPYAEGAMSWGVNICRTSRLPRATP